MKSQRRVLVPSSTFESGNSKKILRFHLALFGGAAKPPDGLDIVARHAFARRIHLSKLELRDRVPLIGQRSQELDGSVRAGV